MSEELKQEWEDKLITTLPECDIKVIDDYYSLKLAKQQEETIADYQINYEQKHIASALAVQKAEIISLIYSMILNKEVDDVEASKIINKIRNETN